jgi:hypothetical protein
MLASADALEKCAENSPLTNDGPQAVLWLFSHAWIQEINMRHFSGDTEGMRLLMDDELEKVAGGEGEDTDDVQVAGIWGWISSTASNVVAGIAGNAANNALAREGAIGGMFDPGQVAQATSAWSNEGGTNVLVPAWNMQNGDTFIDTNHNNMPDIIFRADPAGGVWKNEGAGWQQVYSPGT